MRNPVLGAMTFALTSLASPLISPGSAAPYAYCAAGASTCGDVCDYATLEQCRAFVNGAGGYCVRNPRYTSAANAMASTPRPRR